MKFPDIYFHTTVCLQKKLLISVLQHSSKRVCDKFKKLFCNCPDTGCKASSISFYFVFILDIIITGVLFDMSNLCVICKKDATKRCVKCLKSWYCSRECQVADWKSHKKECNKSKEKAEMEDPTKLIQTLMDNHHISNISNENPKTNKKVPIYKGNEPCWSVVKIEGKGDGVVAKRDIEYGELIAQERPVMKILAHQENEDSLKAMFANLSEQEQLSVTSLCDSRSKDGTKSLLGIKQSNSFAKDAEGQLSVICPKLSKFNHSCLQNVDHVFVEPFQRVYAVRNIQKGEELCTAYVR